MWKRAAASAAAAPARIRDVLYDVSIQPAAVAAGAGAGGVPEKGKEHEQEEGKEAKEAKEVAGGGGEDDARKEDVSGTVP